MIFLSAGLHKKIIWNIINNDRKSIEAYILENVAGVKDVRCYENPYNVEDELGRPPHCVEVIVDGGDEESNSQGNSHKRNPEELRLVAILWSMFSESMGMRYRSNCEDRNLYMHGSMSNLLQMEVISTQIMYP